MHIGLGKISQKTDPQIPERYRYTWRNSFLLSEYFTFKVWWNIQVVFAFLESYSRATRASAAGINNWNILECDCQLRCNADLLISSATHRHGNLLPTACFSYGTLSEKSATNWGNMSCSFRWRAVLRHGANLLNRPITQVIRATLCSSWKRAIHVSAFILFEVWIHEDDGDADYR